MRLEDALLFVVFNADTLQGADLHALAADVIGVGADIVAVKSSGAADLAALEAVSKACREEDALFLVWDDPELVQKVDAAGVHLGNADAAIGTARGIAGLDSIVGYSTRNLEQAALAAETGADYIVHHEGAMCAAVFEQMRGAGLANLYAAGFGSLEEARQAIGSGVFRICVEVNSEDEAKPEVIAEYSKMFGRVV